MRLSILRIVLLWAARSSTRNWLGNMDYYSSFSGRPRLLALTSQVNTPQWQKNTGRTIRQLYSSVTKKGKLWHLEQIPMLSIILVYQIVTRYVMVALRVVQMELELTTIISRHCCTHCRQNRLLKRKKIIRPTVVWISTGFLFWRLCRLRICFHARVQRMRRIIPRLTVRNLFVLDYGCLLHNIKLKVSLIKIISLGLICVCS